MTRNTAARKGQSPNPAAATKLKAVRTNVKVKEAAKPIPKRSAAAVAKPVPKRVAKAAVAPIAVACPSPSPSRDSKQAQLIASLRPAPGVTIGQMMALTGWQAHTVRGAISGVLRKKLGLNVACEPSAEGGARLYRIVETTARA